MLLNWLLKRTKCASLLNRRRFESASGPGWKKMPARRSAEKDGYGCASRGLGSDEASHNFKTIFAFESTGTNAHGWKRKVGGWYR